MAEIQKLQLRKNLTASCIFFNFPVSTFMKTTYFSTSNLNKMDFLS